MTHPYGVAQARARIETTHEWLDHRTANRQWAAGALAPNVRADSRSL